MTVVVNIVDGPSVRSSRQGRSSALRAGSVIRCDPSRTRIDSLPCSRTTPEVRYALVVWFTCYGPSQLG
jgi:hypothetical protein